MEDLCEKLLKLVNKPEEYLRPSNKLQKWMKQTRITYNFIKKEEEKYSLPLSENALHCLKTDGLDTEQIWQLLELQNKSLLAAPDDLNGLDDINLCFNVAKLSSLAKYNKLVPEVEKQEKESKDDDENDEDSLLSESSDENDDDDDMENDSEDEDEGMGSLENVDEEMSENELSDEDIFDNPADIDGGLNLVFSDDSDKEEDNFDEFIAPEGMEDSEDEDDGDKNVKAKALKRTKKDLSNDAKKKVEESSDEEEKVEKLEIVKHPKPSKKRKFQSTEVDSKFFHLRESEWVADNDIIGDNFDMDSDDIDMMKDISDEDEGEGGLMYDAFFDKEETEESKMRSIGMKKENIGSDEDGDTDEDDKESDNQVKDEDPLHVDSKEVTQLLGLTKKEEKSTFEKERERELMLMSTLEEDNITEKPWFLKGEIVSADRPENSTLEEQLEYNIAARQRPVITEDTTTLVEKIILNRIRSKAWDDVERVVKPNLDPYEYKKKLLLDQDKSKKTLAEIYEEEYLKQQKKDNDSKEEEEFPEHTEIREKMDEIFSMLDALANYHYTPTAPSADIKIQSNLPAVTVEEATPVTASDANLLAPQEILAPIRGELRGKSEFSATDRKRERRVKKSFQMKKAKLQERKIQESLKKSAGGKKLDAKTTLNVVQKAVKAGQVKMLDGQQNKVVKSSHTFFKQLQDNVKVNPKDAKVKKSKKNKGDGNLSASKLLL